MWVNEGARIVAQRGNKISFFQELVLNFQSDRQHSFIRSFSSSIKLLKPISRFLAHFSSRGSVNGKCRCPKGSVLLLVLGPEKKARVVLSSFDLRNSHVHAGEHFYLIFLSTPKVINREGKVFSFGLTLKRETLLLVTKFLFWEWDHN